MTWRSFILGKSANLIDGWSIPHFLFGSVTAMVALVFAVPWPWAFGITVVVAIFWEYVEIKIIKINETRGNMIMDVVLPLIAFWLTTTLVSQSNVDHEHRVALLVVTILVYGFTNVMAWAARINQDHEFMG